MHVGVFSECKHTALRTFPNLCRCTPRAPSSVPPYSTVYLNRSVTKETATLLEEAAEAAPHGTKLLLDIVRSCARNARREIAASDALKEVVAMKGGAVEQLAAAIDAAAVFPSLLVRSPRIPHTGRTCTCTCTCSSAW
jgi:hypothetical protein